MIWKIARKEFRELLREGRFRIATGLVAVLLVTAVFTSYNYYRSVRQQHAQAREVARNLWVGQEEKNPHSAAHFGSYVFKPKYPLALIDQGVDKFTGISIFLEAHNRNEARFMAAADQTGLSRFGDLSPDFILLFILPLLIILMGYNAFTRERENGTLGLLKSQGITPLQLALGKWQGLYLPILLLTGGCFLLAGILLGNLQDFGVFQPLGLFVLMGVYLAYYAVLVNLTLLTSALCRRSGIALVALLTVWITVCLAVPKAASNLAESLHPYPTAQEFASRVTADKEAGLDGHNPWSQEAKLLEKQTLEKYGVDSLHQLPFNFDGYRMQKGEEHEAQVYFKHYAHLKSQYEKQTGVYRAAAFLSPFLPTRFLSMAVARTDYQTHWNFADAAEKYRLKMMAALNTDFAENSRYGDWSYRAEAELWSNIPEFRYEPPAYRKIMTQQASNILVLLLWLVLSFTALTLAVRRL